LLLLASGCDPESQPLAGSQYMRPEASGAALGMTLHQLRSVRPHVIVDEEGARESLDRVRTNSFVFQPDPTGASTRGPLQAVITDRLSPTDSTGYYQEIRSQTNAWRRVAGPATDSLRFVGPAIPGLETITYKVVFWCRPDGLLMLIYPTLHTDQTARYFLIRSIVQKPTFQLPPGHGIPYQRIKCR
jgi:hypothetical protein